MFASRPSILSNKSMKTNLRYLLIIIPLLISPNIKAESVQKLSPVLSAFIQEVLNNRSNSAYKNFSVKACPKHKIDWSALIIKQQKQTLTYKFAKGCDIDGTITPQVLAAFPIQFKVRNLDQFDSIMGEAKLGPTLSMKPLLRLDLINTETKSPKEKIKFDAYYEAEIDPFSKTVIGKHLGGKILVKEINGKAVKEELNLPPAQSK